MLNFYSIQLNNEQVEYIQFLFHFAKSGIHFVFRKQIIASDCSERYYFLML